MTDLGLVPRSDDAIRDIIGLGLREAMQVLYPELHTELHTALIERYRARFLAEGGIPMPLFSGARETLTTLRQEGYLLAVATGKSRHGLDHVLAESGLASLFAATRCADETRSKPHPQMLLELMGALGTGPDETLMIGDSEYDLQMALQAGVPSLGVSYGVKDCERLLDYRPLACLDAIDELPAWLDAWRLSGGER